MAAVFPILLEVDEGELGGVLLLLKDRPGIKIKLDLDSVGKKSPRNGASLAAHRAESSRPVIIAELMTGQKNLAYLKEKVREAGGRSQAVSSALYELQKKGITESAGAGLHRLTERAMAELKGQQPQVESPQLVSPPPKTKREIGKSIEFVLKSVRSGLTRSEMRAQAADIGLSERMIDGAITRLKAKEQIVGTTEQGVYKLTPIKPKRST